MTSAKENAGQAPGGFPESVQQAARSVPHDAQAGKWIAMALYNSGSRGLAATQAAFDRHPQWVAA